MSENGIQPEMPEKEKKQGSSAVDKAKSATKKIKDFTSKFGKNKSGGRSLIKVLSKIPPQVIAVILAIMIIIGIIMFFLTMPGLVMEKLKGLLKTIANAWSSWWGKDDATQFDQCQIYQIADYLDGMGYDLKGYGFITDFLYKYDEYDDGGAGDDLQENEVKITGDGVIRAADDNRVVTAVSEFINTYVVSDNYIYTIKNFNVDTKTGWDAFWNHVGALFSPTNALSKRSGMLVFWHDKNGNIGERGGAYGASERGYIKFEGKNLLIKKGWTNGAMQYSLEGWTGRYGMPVDFLLTVHTATMMPDLPYDMATNFKTEVNILLHHTERNCVWSL